MLFLSRYELLMETNSSDSDWTDSIVRVFTWCSSCPFDPVMMGCFHLYTGETQAEFVKSNVRAAAAEWTDPDLHSNQCWCILPEPGCVSPRHASSSSLPDCYWSHFKTAPLNLFPFICCLWFLFWTWVSPRIRFTSSPPAVIPRLLIHREVSFVTCCTNNWTIFWPLWLQICQERSRLSSFPKCLKSITGEKSLQGVDHLTLLNSTATASLI